MELVDSLDELGIRYQLGGSVASSIYGIPRGTRDIDVEADIKLEHVEEFVRKLEDRYMIFPEVVLEAIEHRYCFNLIPLLTIAKIDIFIPKDRPYDRMAAERRQFGVPIDEQNTAPYWINSREDVILRKLEWYRLGNHVSNQKWEDVLGVLKARSTEFDLSYLRRWAAELGISDLLERAFEESGLKAGLDSDK